MVSLALEGSIVMKTHRIDVDEGLCQAARRLVKEGVASPEDRIEAYRGEQLCLISSVGWAATHMLDKNSLRYKKWVPFGGHKK